MYEAYFGLNSRPFAPVSQAQQYFPAAAIEAARQTLIRCIQRAEGPAMVVGPSGTGKTLLCQVLVDHFKDSFQVVVLSSGRISSRRALLQAILFGLGRPYRGMDEGELRLAMVDYLTGDEHCPQDVLLLVDEAHTLPLRLLEELRMVTNLVCNGQPRIRLVLAGGPLLEERLASPKLESFSQRIVARCYLESFSRCETQEYLHAQTDQAGDSADELFSPEACQSVYQATDGVPRLINQLCDHALLLAYSAGRRQVDRAGVEEAWADLQQLPTPWNQQSRDDQAAGGVIEFGRLDDQHSELDEPDDPDQQTVKMLRVAPQPDEPAPELPQQVESIQQMLAELDQDFQPAGSIGPEVELVFDDSGDPFNEQFEEEEEVIVDGCASTCQSRGEEPSGVFRKDDGLRTEPSDAPTTSSIQQQRSAGPPKGEAASKQQPVGDDVAETAAAGSHPLQAPVHWSQEPETVPLHRRSRPEAVEADETARPADKFEPKDGEMIIVEDGYDDDEAPQKRPTGRVRRLEYRQLFATLRRGG